jgi:hypothetical protein
MGFTREFAARPARGLAPGRSRPREGEAENGEKLTHAQRIQVRGGAGLPPPHAAGPAADQQAGRLRSKRERLPSQRSVPADPRAKNGTPVQAHQGGGMGRRTPGLDHPDTTSEERLYIELAII